jgi:tetratricopeptide (TPR) repeat protein
MIFDKHKKAETLLGKGREYALRDEYDKAIELYTKAIQIYPEFTEAYKYRGIAYGFTGDYEKAIDDNYDMIKLDPNIGNSSLNSAFIQLYIKKSTPGELTLGETGSGYKNAIADYTGEIRLNPDNAKLYFKRGYTYGFMAGGSHGSLNDYEKAIEDYTQTIQLDPDNAAIFLIRANAYKLMGNFDKAIADFIVALMIKPDYYDALSSRLYLAIETGNSDQAISDLNEMIKLNPNDVNSYIRRGDIYVDKGEFDKAIEDFEKALQFKCYNGMIYPIEERIRAIKDGRQGNWTHKRSWSTE